LVPVYHNQYKEYVLQTQKSPAALVIFDTIIVVKLQMPD